MPQFDCLIRNVRLVRPGVAEVASGDIGIRGGRFVSVGPAQAPDQAATVVDGQGWLAFPGLVDAHMHCGIYKPLAEDAVTESRAAAMGGVTSSLNYMRTGQYYLNRGGSWRDFIPEVLRLSEGRFHVDYGYHLAPIAAGHIDEMPLALDEHGVSSFKIFMFYGGYGLHGRSSSQQQFLMIGDDERYDVAHFEFVMRGLTRLRAARPAAADAISVSLHCELAEILTAYSRLVEKDPSLTGLRAYSAARPPHSEGLAICVAAYLAYETECVNVNLLHLSSRKAVEAALMMAATFPHVDFRREVTIGHLLLDYDAPTGVLAKVNPPIRSRDDVEFLWHALLEGKIDWVCSDHACCSGEMKGGAGGDIWVAKSGFGGTEYLLSGLHSEGRRRGLPLHRIAELTSANPARRFGLGQKGDLAPGFDADLVLFDPDETFTVRAAESPSAQGHTPFEGVALRGRVKQTYLRGGLVYDRGEVVGAARGRYLRRPARR
jgi:allantoinase